MENVNWTILIMGCMFVLWFIVSFFWKRVFASKDVIQELSAKGRLTPYIIHRRINFLLMGVLLIWDSIEFEMSGKWIFILVLVIAVLISDFVCKKIHLGRWIVRPWE